MSIKKIMTAGLSLGLALVAGAAAPAVAADWNYGDGMAKARRGGAAVPVPAPEPVPDTMSGYYVRLDAAYNYSDTKHLRSSYPTVDSMRSDEGMQTFGRYGLGAGYTFSRWFRADVTFDTRSEMRGKANDSITYSVTNPGYAGPGNAAQFQDTAFDRIRYKNYTGMLNGYFDIPMGQAFTPYIGLGVGFVHHRATRVLWLSQDCIDAVDCDPSAVNPPAPGTPVPLNVNTVNVAGKDTQWGLATAAMAGVAYQFSRSGKIDLGYRWLHLEGVTFNHGGQSLTVPDQDIHELRVGLRYDIN